jgi:hypothetical protein
MRRIMAPLQLGDHAPAAPNPIISLLQIRPNSFNQHTTQQRSPHSLNRHSPNLKVTSFRFIIRHQSTVKTMPENIKPDPAKTPDPKPQNWWQTLPGLITAIATIITAIAGLLTVLHQTDIFRPKSDQSAVPPSAINPQPASPEPAIAPTTPSVAAPSSSTSNTAKSLASGQEVKLQGDTYLYKILEARLEPANTELNLLKFKVRVTNNDQYDMNFWDRSFRLAINGIRQAPTNTLNELVESQSSKEGEVVFEIPTTTQEATLQIMYSESKTDIPFDLTTAKP